MDAERSHVRNLHLRRNGFSATLDVHYYVSVLVAFGK